jgi:hypothetical protein
MPDPALEVLYADEVVVYADVRGIWLMLLRGPPDEARMRRAGPTLAEMSKRYPDGVVTVMLVLPSAGSSMDAPSRKAAAQVTDAHATLIRAMSTVIEGAGFWPASVRAIVSAVQLLSRSRSPRQVFDNVDAAVAWALTHAPASTRDGFDRAAAVAAITALAQGR